MKSDKGTAMSRVNNPLAKRELIMAIFKSPVGHPAARDAALQAGLSWPPPWEDSNPYLREYTLGGRPARHTGADLNIPSGGDLHEPVYAIGVGQVIHAKEIEGSSTWGNVVVIYHGVVKDETGDPYPVFSRYAHLESIEDDIKTKKVVDVTSETIIGNVGSGPAGSKMDNLLHFDISPSRKFFEDPGDWPWEDLGRLETDYVNPDDWLRKPHTLVQDTRGNPVNDTPQAAASTPAATNVTWHVTAPAGTEFRPDLKTSSQPPLILFHKMRFTSVENVQPQLQEEYLWLQISETPIEFKGFWVKYKKADDSEIFISRQPPA
jgi:hypothetical protein